MAHPHLGLDKLEKEAGGGGGWKNLCVAIMAHILCAYKWIPRHLWRWKAWDQTGATAPGGKTLRENGKTSCGSCDVV